MSKIDVTEYDYSPREEAIKLVIAINKTIADSGLDEEGVGAEAIALLYGAHMVGQQEEVQGALQAIAQYGADSFGEYVERKEG